MNQINVYAVLHKVLADPHLLVDLLREAESETDAVMALCRGFDITPAEAKLVMDAQFKILCKERMAAIDPSHKADAVDPFTT